MRPADASEPREHSSSVASPPPHTSGERTPLQSAHRSKAHTAPKRTPSKAHTLQSAHRSKAHTLQSAHRSKAHTLQSADESPIYLPSLIVDSFDDDFFILNQVQARSKIFLHLAIAFLGRPLLFRATVIWVSA
jgi:hypothetical protein